MPIMASSSPTLQLPGTAQATRVRCTVARGMASKAWIGATTRPLRKHHLRRRPQGGTVSQRTGTWSSRPTVSPRLSPKLARRGGLLQPPGTRYAPSSTTAGCATAWSTGKEGAFFPLVVLLACQARGMQHAAQRPHAPPLSLCATPTLTLTRTVQHTHARLRARMHSLTHSLTLLHPRARTHTHLKRPLVRAHH